ncbi:unnamed protein product [Lymnaea stagnalis]|uniref:Major facilitator superfamily (MFS) profile domain-containing protein n=1 Tax=Lymnaea stagnalis TaxID=6523 RepID=A0AAV2IIC6_LYMST
MSGGRHRVDDILTAVNPTGMYQVLHLVVTTFASFPSAFQLLSNIFICRSVPHRCSQPINSSQIYPLDHKVTNVTYGRCDVTFWSNGTILYKEQCPYGTDYDLDLTTSAVSEFDLVCDRANLARLSQTLVIAGQGVGAVLATILSDRFGRKVVLVTSNLGMLVSGLVVAFAPNYSVFAVFKFCAGAFQQGTVTSMVTLLLEMFPSRHRRITATYGGLTWAIGAMTMALVAYLFRDHSWRMLQLALSCVSILALFQLWFLDESLRWLMANSQSERALKVIKRAAKMNGIKLEAVLQVFGNSKSVDGMMSSNHEPQIQPDVLKLNEEKSPKMTLIDAFRDRSLFITSLVTWFAWFTTALGYFVIYLNSVTLSGDRFLNYFLTATMEIPSNIFFYFSLNRFGRRTTTVIPFVVLGTAVLAAGLFKKLEQSNPVFAHLTLTSSLVAMIGASGCFGVVFLYTPEMFPTNYRNQALGVASLIGRIGGMLAPFMGLLADQAVWAPGLAIAFCSLLVCLLMRCLPETNGRELPQNIEELQNWS